MYNKNKLTMALIPHIIDEVEIKIEYFESFETDPLCEKSVNPTGDTKDSLTSTIFDENINQHASNRYSKANVKESLENNESVENNQNEYLIVSENEETWYKSIDSIGRYLCKFCDHSYSTIQTVRHHVKNKHKDDYHRIKSTAIEKIRRCKLKCHICKKRFKNSTNLQEHIKTHDINNIQKSCFICHATFDNDTDSLTHMANKHESVRKKTHFCFSCGYSTSKISHFKQHEKIHSRIDLKKCTYCEYTTYHPPNLKIHERIHTNDKPYICTFNGCDYRCAAKSGLSSHWLKHEKEKNMMYCDKCSYSTVYKQSLKKHMDSHRRNCVRTRF